MSRQEGLDLLAKYAWDTSDVARKEMTRYQSGPGQASAYMIGQLTIQKLRDYAEEALKDDFNLKEFHYQVKNTCAFEILNTVVCQGFMLSQSFEW